MSLASRALALVVCLSLSLAGFAAPSGTVTIEPQVREHLSHFDVSSPTPVDVIVTLAAEPAGVTAAKAKENGGSANSARDAQLNRIRAERGNLFSHLRRNGIDVGPKHEFELAINGFALTIPANHSRCWPRFRASPASTKTIRWSVKTSPSRR